MQSPTAVRRPRPPSPILVESLLEAAEVSAAAGAEEEDDEALAIDSYSWEGGYDRSWDKLVDEGGFLGNRVNRRNKKEQTKSVTPARKGILRNLVIAIDASESMKDSDFKPDRLRCVLSIVEEFISAFFESNPLGQLGMTLMLHGQALTLSIPSGNPQQQIAKVHELSTKDFCGGNVSLLNGLDRGLGLLARAPPYGTRELVVLFGSIYTSDAGNIEEVITELKARGVRTSVISLSPELYVLKRICKETEGVYRVVRSREELYEAVMYLKTPPDWSQAMEARLVPMAFPKPTHSVTASLCMCHNTLSLQGYICPRCHSKACEIPTKCRICQLHLASAADVARTSQHLIPPPPSHPIQTTERLQCQFCYAMFTEGGTQCSKCRVVLCGTCDSFRSDILHQCPTCLCQQEMDLRRKLLST